MGMDWIDPVQNKDTRRDLVNAIRKPLGSIKCGEFID
jgi:hypothetical protein